MTELPQDRLAELVPAGSARLSETGRRSRSES